MKEISLLSQDTIDKIAAGEVVERPASIVKELVENAVDAGANAITVEIAEGGISLVRITDNGSGIQADQVPMAFLRHATSKIRTVDDLLTSGTLGFRGEALSSIAAVCQVELITKTPGALLGTRYVIEGGAEKTLEEVGAPEGTTFIVRNLFYNTPARRKFLKSAKTEAGYINDLLERLAVSHPGIAFKFICNGDTKLHTSGNSNLKDIVYGIYGRDVAANVVKIDTGNDHFRLHGFIGKPVISRGNRNYENYFVNGRYVKSNILARAIEDAYKPFMMHHRYPFTALLLEADTALVDVNVHPTKMEVRFANPGEVYDLVLQAVKDGLMGRELIPEFTIDDKTKSSIQDRQTTKAPSDHEKNGSYGGKTEKQKKFRYPEPFEKVRSQLIAESDSPYERKYPDFQKNTAAFGNRFFDAARCAPQPKTAGTMRTVTGMVTPREEVRAITPEETKALTAEETWTSISKETRAALSEEIRTSIPEEARAAALKEAQTGISAVPPETKPLQAEWEAEGQMQTAVQMELFEEKLLDQASRSRHNLIGQLFDTYWIVEFEEKMYIIDQHAAHEKVMYERFMANYRAKKQTSQMITPPVIVTLSMQEETLLKQHMEQFEAVGFELEPFGGREYSIRAVPGNLYGIADRTLFLEMLDGLSDVSERTSSQAVFEKIASMSCKAAVKGNQQLTAQEADALIEELLSLENPYNCPHGRPTIVSMTKYELEKKFKRIV